MFGDLARHEEDARSAVTLRIAHRTHEVLAAGLANRLVGVKRGACSDVVADHAMHNEAACLASLLKFARIDRLRHVYAVEATLLEQSKLLNERGISSHHRELDGF